MLTLRCWRYIQLFSPVDVFLPSYHLSVSKCVNTVMRNSLFIMPMIDVFKIHLDTFNLLPIKKHTLQQYNLPEYVFAHHNFLLIFKFNWHIMNVRKPRIVFSHTFKIKVTSLGCLKYQQCQVTYNII